MKTGTLTVLLHGAAFVGKSWLGASAPAPRLIIDAEGRAEYTPSQLGKVYWDVMAGGPPRYDGTWDTCIALCPDYQTMSRIYQWLRAGEHDFVSIVIDSLMEIQKRCQDQIAGAHALDQQDWGALLRELEKLVRDYRDLKTFPTNPTRVIVFITGSTNNEGTWEPFLQGQLRNTLPYFIDLCAYYFKRAVTSPDGTAAGFARELLVDQRPGFIAGDHTNFIISAYPSGIVENPNIAQLAELCQQQGGVSG